MKEKKVQNIIDILQSIRPLWSRMTQQDKRGMIGAKQSKVFYINKNRKGGKK
jgi:hypothetical protein